MIGLQWVQRKTHHGQFMRKKKIVIHIVNITKMYIFHIAIVSSSK